MESQQFHCILGIEKLCSKFLPFATRGTVLGLSDVSPDKLDIGFPTHFPNGYHNGFSIISIDAGLRHSFRQTLQRSTKWWDSLKLDIGGSVASVARFLE